MTSCTKQPSNRLASWLIKRGDGSGLREQHETTRDSWEMPASVLPFAGSVGPPKVFLCLEGKMRGRVVINGAACEDKRDAGEALSPEDFFVVADSFSAFVAGLFWMSSDDRD